MTKPDLLSHFKPDPESRKKHREKELMKSALKDVPLSIQPSKPINAFDAIKARVKRDSES